MFEVNLTHVKYRRLSIAFIFHPSVFDWLSGWSQLRTSGRREKTEGARGPLPLSLPVTLPFSSLLSQLFVLSFNRRHVQPPWIAPRQGLITSEFFSVPNKPSQLIFRVKFRLMPVKIFIFHLGVNFCKKKTAGTLLTKKKHKRAKLKVL